MSTTTPAPPATAAQSARTAGIAAAAFGALFVLGFPLAGQVPGYDDSDSEWIRWAEESSSRIPIVVGTMLFVVAAAVLVVLTSALAQGGGAADRRDALARAVLPRAGVLAAAVLLVAAVIGGAMPAGVTFAPDFEPPSADVLRAFDQLSIGLLLVGFGWSMAVVVACASRVADLPGWLRTAGYVVAVLLLFSVMFLPLLLVPLWAIALGVVLLRTSSRPA